MLAIESKLTPAGLKKSRALGQERQATSTGGVNPQLTKKSTEADNGEVSEIVASKVGIGSKDTYRKEKYIVDNVDTLKPKEEQTRYPRTGGIDFRLLSTWLTLGYVVNFQPPSL